MTRTSLWSEAISILVLAAWCAPCTSAANQGGAQPQVRPNAVRERLNAPGAQAGQAAKPPAKTQPAETPIASQPVARRDPFDPLVKKGTGKGGRPDVPEPSIPGIAGLVVASMRLNGIVRGPNGMLAVVSNPQQRTYFLREGDVIYNGKIERISMEGIVVTERGKDPWGKPVERQVVKRLYPSAGEQ